MKEWWLHGSGAIHAQTSASRSLHALRYAGLWPKAFPACLQRGLHLPLQLRVPFSREHALSFLLLSLDLCACRSLGG